MITSEHKMTTNQNAAARANDKRVIQIGVNSWVAILYNIILLLLLLLLLIVEKMRMYKCSFSCYKLF